jgi:hypothetical protein
MKDTKFKVGDDFNKKERLSLPNGKNHQMKVRQH